MIDPNLVIGATLIVIGYGAGRIHLVKNNKATLSSSPLPICGCTHSLAHHDKKTDKCFGQILQKDVHDGIGNNHWVDCTCRQYVGPQPIENYFTTPTIFNDEDK